MTPTRLFALWIGLTLLLAAYIQPVAKPKETFSMYHKSNVQGAMIWVLVDDATGCQYIVARSGVDFNGNIQAIVPRYDYAHTANKIVGCK